jgi:hypothetical protein
VKRGVKNVRGVVLVSFALGRRADDWRSIID